MKVKCRPNDSEKKWAREDRSIRQWVKAPPFNVNPRGVLTHRVRSVATFIRDGEVSHYSVHYWCANGTNGDGVGLVEKPPKDRLLCAHCERIAVEHGERTAEELTGRHVCIGVMKVHRLCCGHEDN